MLFNFVSLDWILAHNWLQIGLALHTRILSPNPIQPIVISDSGWEIFAEVAFLDAKFLLNSLIPFKTLTRLIIWTVHSCHDRIDSTGHRLPLTDHRNVLAWPLVHHSVVRWVYAGILWLPFLGLWRVANIPVCLHDSVDKFVAIGGSKIVHLVLSILFVVLNLSLNETLILRKTLTNLLAAPERNILIGATRWDVFIPARQSVVTAIGTCLLGLDFDQVNL